jgi:hypothetical protein
MTLNQILSKLLKNGGLTLDHNGKEVSKERGYMVSLQGYEVKLDVNDHKAMQKLAYELQAKMSQAWRGVYIGLWLDKGQVYLDLSEYFTDYEDAMSVAKRREQLAIFDFFTQSSEKVA